MTPSFCKEPSRRGGHQTAGYAFAYFEKIGLLIRPPVDAAVPSDPREASVLTAHQVSDAPPPPKCLPE